MALDSPPAFLNGLRGEEAGLKEEPLREFEVGVGLNNVMTAVLGLGGAPPLAPPPPTTVVSGKDTISGESPSSVYTNGGGSGDAPDADELLLLKMGIPYRIRSADTPFN